MITGRDDFLNHQIAKTFDHVGSAHRNWTEKMWFTMEDSESGDVIVACGIGQYPNRDVQDAFAGVSCGGKQYNVRMSRKLRPDLDSMTVGPFSIEVVRPLRTFRLRLDENASGVSFDIEWEATFQAHEEAHHFERDGETILQDLVRYAQAGRASGIVRIPGRTFRLEKAKWYAQRDHSWGVRPWVGGDSPKPAGPSPEYMGLFTWSPIQFKDYGIFCFLTEKTPGVPTYLSGGILRPFEDTKPEDEIVAVEHDIRFVVGAPVLTAKSADLTMTFKSGVKKEVAVKTLPARYLLRGGLYGGYRGWWHGDWKGPYYFEHDVWDVTDPATLKEIGFFGDHVAEFRCGNDVGYGIFEYAVTPGYPRYTEVQQNWG